MTQAKPEMKLRSFEAALPIALLRARAAAAGKFKPLTDAQGISQQQWRVVRALAGGEPLDSKTIAYRCALLPPSVSRIIRSLQDRGLVEPGNAPDNRTRPMQLTETGRRLFDAVAADSEAIYREIENAFGRDRLQNLLAELVALTTTCESLPDFATSRTNAPEKETAE